MSPSKFIDILLNTYQTARTPLHEHDKLRRGESRTIASEIEDLLAFYLVENLPEIDNIRINQPLSVFFDKTRKTIKPDITIIRSNKIVAFVDLKMDFGYARNRIDSIFDKANCHMAAMRGKEITFWNGKRTEGGEKFAIEVSEASIYIFVVVSDQNVNRTIYSRAEVTASSSNILLHTLMRGVHPNDHALSEIEIRMKCLEQVNENLKRLRDLIADALV